MGSGEHRKHLKSFNLRPTSHYVIFLGSKSVSVTGNVRRITVERELPKPRDPSEPRPDFPRPKPYVEPPPTPCQHVRILDCNQPVSRIFYECYHCKQGLLTESESKNPITEVDVKCPSCGRTAIRLLTNTVISTTPIPSPWQ